jgi:endoglucanase
LSRYSRAFARVGRRASLRNVAASIATVSVAVLAGPVQPAPAATQTLEAEGFSLASSAGGPYSDAAASGGRGLLMWNNATASQSFTTETSGSLAIRARGDQCSGAPKMTLRVDGIQVLSAGVSSTSFTTYDSTIQVAAGTHTLAVSYDNDYRSKRCDRNLRLDMALITTPDPAPAPTLSDEPAASPTLSETVTSTEASVNPLAGVKLYVDPYSAAKKQADAWRSTRPADAAQLDKIATRPQADWFGEWSGDIEASVSNRVGTATAAGAMPVLVAYNIPQRDCGSYSAGGLSSADAYKTWIRSFAKGIGTRSAVVILEPDALAMLGCLSSSDQSTRLALLKDAVDVLEAQPAVSVYVDAGHSHWIGAAEMASRLTNAGVARAQGFAVNVSNYRLTTELLSYGRDLSARLGGKHFVVDTSRNGLGPSADGQWCNPSGRALGAAPTTSTADSAVDAYLWIKKPGESDGTCNGGPSAGTFWADYALGLAQRAL